MERWEKEYVGALIDSLHPFGDVLEVGFRKGYAASQIQKFHPKSHTIIEPNPDLAEEARKLPGIVVVEESWQTALPHLGVFDAIFFNRCEEEPLPLFLQEGKELLQEIEGQFPDLKKMRYSEDEIALFCKQMGASAPQEMGQFLQELEDNGQISSELRKKMVKKYRLKEGKPPKIKGADPVFPFLKNCLQNHMRKGSRFTCFCSSPHSKYEDRQFFEEIITNPFVNYQEYSIPLKVPKSCKDYPYRQGLVILVEKL